MVSQDHEPGDGAADELTRLVYDGTFETVHREARDILRHPVFDHRDGLTAEQEGRLAYERTRTVHHRMGPAEKTARDPLRLTAAGEWSCLLDTTTLPLLMSHYNLCLGTILTHGRERDDLEDHLAELREMSSVGVLMVSELGYGNNASALETEAVYDPERREFVLNTPAPRARKFMPYTGIPDIPKLAVVLARLVTENKDRGVFPFLVRVSDENGLRPGIHAVKCPEKAGLALDNGITWFDHVRIPRRNLLAGDMATLEADGTFRAAITGKRARFLRALERVHLGRLCLAGAVVAAGRAAISLTVTYGQRRLTAAPGHGSVAVMAYRSHQREVLTSLAKVYATTFLVNHVKRWFDAGGEADAELQRLVALTKALCGSEMSEVLHACRERCGAQGMLRINRIPDYVAMAQGVVTAEGDNLPLLSTTAYQLLQHEEQAEESTPAPPRDSEDPSWHIRLLRFRERRLRQRARERMRDRLRGEATLLEAWNDSSTLAIDMAHTRAARIALECFHDAADASPHPRARAALRRLASLYGLLTVRGNADWYLANRALTPEQTDALPDMVDGLCSRIAPDAELLTEGFAIPAELLRAPIAGDDHIAAMQRFASEKRGATDGTEAPEEERV
ncbi:Acyl-coenzyme A oxidase [Actinopolyspora alba]|uniref:Acyl-coenzyme A oxidase n=1 Tax=Actinopolyspora alba TaxID=673379 RepID=A0A1I1USR0_9ACTN|nr:acyl-CoA dehydrogenase [Actinopolyspora alba]SFD72708.1 Acyl-coenzyme A oxidase [Actinopolyspora alba]